MNIKLLLHTIRHLKLEQLVYQVYYRIVKPKFKMMPSPVDAEHVLFRGYIPKSKCFDRSVFTFLNIGDQFHGWDFQGHGALWAYNLNYMDWLLQEGIPYEAGAEWIDRFVNDISVNKVGLDPYPMALRGINWIKFISIHHEFLDKNRLQKWNDSLYSQYRLLERKLEYHLLGNHLLEDAYSLYIASIYFHDRRMYLEACKLLRKQLNEQILLDGAHYEQSPMYHCILLDRLLDCCNISSNNLCFDEQKEMTSFLKTKASMMLGHLASIIWDDGDIPMLNDSAINVAPISADLFNYARCLSISWKNIPLKECGYRKFKNEQFEAIADVGNMTASYQPGHSHADTFSYELYINGLPFIVDAGISTYNKSVRRQLERSTAAHNTVTVDSRNSSEVWGGFRVGKRAKVRILGESGTFISASHDGFGKSAIHTREFRVDRDFFCVSDNVTGVHECKSFIHFAPDIEIESVSNERICTQAIVISIDRAYKVEIIDTEVSSEYNKAVHNKTAVLYFEHDMKYKIELK